MNESEKHIRWPDSAATRMEKPCHMWQLKSPRKTTLKCLHLRRSEGLTERIRERAFQIFDARRGGDGNATEDWLRAESDLLCSTEAGDVKVTALPDALIVNAASTHSHEKNEGNAFCEFGQKSLFRRFDLPETINPDKVTADLDKGVLRLTVFKAKQSDASRQKAAVT